MNLYIEVELLDREFRSRFLLACEAALKGFDVYILSRDEMSKLISTNSISNGIYHMKDANSTELNINYLKKIKNKNFIITAQDEETGLTYNSFEDFAKRRFANGNAFDHIDLYFCYGQFDFNVLSKKFNKNSFLISGSPRFDLANKKFYKNKDIFLKENKLKKYLLISSNIQYPISEKSLATQFNSRINLSDTDNQNLSYKKENYFIKYRQSVEQLQKFLILIKVLSDNIEDLDIVIRPHPSESIKTWEILTKDILNRKILIKKDKSLIEYINFSEALIHSGCTAAIEAYCIKKKIISYVPNNFTDNFDANFPNELGVKIKNPEDILNQVKLIAEFDNENIRNNVEIKQRLYNYNLENLSVELIVKKWIEMYTENNIGVQKNFFKINVRNFISYNRRKIKKSLSSLKSSFFGKNNKTYEAFPDLDKQNIDECFKNFCNFDKKFINIKYKICNNKILRVYKF